MIRVESFGEDELKRIYTELTDKGDWFEECALCRMPTLLHKGSGSCTRKTCTPEEYGHCWNVFKKKMRSVINWYTDDQEKTRSQSEFMQMMKNQNDMMNRLME